MKITRKENIDRSFVLQQAIESQKESTRNNWTLQTEEDSKYSVNTVKASRFNYDDELEGLRQSRAARGQ